VSTTPVISACWRLMHYDEKISGARYQTRDLWIRKRVYVLPGHYTTAPQWVHIVVKNVDSINTKTFETKMWKHSIKTLILMCQKWSRNVAHGYKLGNDVNDVASVWKIIHNARNNQISLTILIDYFVYLGFIRIKSGKNRVFKRRPTVLHKMGSSNRPIRCAVTL